MPNEETLARVVGLLTTACESRHEQGQSDDDAVATYSSLLADLGGEGFQIPILIDASDPPEVIQATIQEAFNDALARVVRDAEKQFAGFAAAFMYAFVELATEYEATCADADVRGLLQRLGAQAAEDGG